MAALVIEAAVGYPEALYRAIGHPVTWMGALLAALERRLNRGGALRAARPGGDAGDRCSRRRRLPALVAAGLALPVRGSASCVLAVLASTPAGAAQPRRSCRAVADALDAEGLEGRAAGGRDDRRPRPAGAGRAPASRARRSRAWRRISPTAWSRRCSGLAVVGLPGGGAYKAANTADTMIGHRSERYSDFGWAAARFDDLVNLPASRLAALWIVLAARLDGAPRAAWAAVRRDAGASRSPNAGWPEAAMAGALGLKLAGPRVYGGVLVEDASWATAAARRAPPTSARRCGSTSAPAQSSSRRCCNGLVHRMTDAAFPKHFPNPLSQL